MKKTFIKSIIVEYAAAEPVSETKKPLNVLWLVAEDLSPDYLSLWRF